MIVNGTNLVLTINGTTVATATEVSLETYRETHTATLSPSNGHRQRIIGRRTGTIDFSGMLDDGSLNDYSPGDIVNWRFGFANGVFNGECYIGSISFYAGTDEAPTRSGSFEITGEARFAEVTSDILCIDGQPVCIDGEQVRVLI